MKPTIKLQSIILVMAILLYTPILALNVDISIPTTNVNNSIYWQGHTGTDGSWLTGIIADTLDGFHSTDFCYANGTNSSGQNCQVSVAGSSYNETYANYVIANISNSTNCWSTTEGVKCDVADITYDEIGGGDVNAIGYTGFFSFIQGVVGMLSMDGDPWYLGGTSLEISDDLVIGGTILPNDTIMRDIGSGALRWNILWVRNISSENIDNSGQIKSGTYCNSTGTCRDLSAWGTDVDLSLYYLKTEVDNNFSLYYLVTNPHNFLNSTTIGNSTIVRSGNYNCTGSNIIQNITVNSSGVFGQCIAQSGGGGGTDHGALTGLADDDHTQYVLADGTRAMTALTVDNSADADLFINLDSGVTSDVYNTGFYLKSQGTTKWGIFKDSSNNLRFRQYAGGTIDPLVVQNTGNAFVLKNLTSDKYCNSTGTCKDLSLWGGSTDLSSYWTSSQLLNGTLVQNTTLYNNFVPYQNAISNVNLGVKNLNATVITATSELIVDKLSANAMFRLKNSGTEKGTIYALNADNDLHVRATHASGRLYLTAGGSATDGILIGSDGNVNLGANTLTTTGTITGGTTSTTGDFVLKNSEQGLIFADGDAEIYLTADDDSVHFTSTIGSNWIFDNNLYADDYLYNSDIFNVETTAIQELLNQKDILDSKTGKVTHSNYSSQIYKTTSKIVNGTNIITGGVSVSAMDNVLRKSIIELYNENQILKSYKSKTENCLSTSDDFVKYKNCMGGITL